MAGICGHGMMADKEISSTEEDPCPFLGSTSEVTEVHSETDQTPSKCRLEGAELSSHVEAFPSAAQTAWSAFHDERLLLHDCSGSYTQVFRNRHSLHASRSKKVSHWQKILTLSS